MSRPPDDPRSETTHDASAGQWRRRASATRATKLRAAEGA